MNVTVRNLLRLIPYLKAHKGALLLGLLSIAASNLLAVWAWAWVKRAVDSLGKEGVTAEAVFQGAAITLLVFCLSALFRFLMRWLISGVSRRIEFTLRNDLFEKFTLLPPSYYDTHGAGDLMARATNDLEAVRAVLGPGLMYPVNAAVLLPSVLLMMLRISPMLTLLSLAPLLLAPLVVRFFGRWIHRRFKQVQEYYGELNDRVRENLLGIRVVKAFAREEKETEEFLEMNREFRRRTMRLMGAQTVFFPLLRTLVTLGQVVLIAAGIRLMSGGEGGGGGLTAGGFLAFLGLHSELAWPMIALGWVVNVLERGSVSMGRIAQVMDAAPRPAAEAKPAEEGGSPPSRGGIECRDLTFSYGGEPVLRNVSFRLPPGGTLGMVGPVGSGKSTLLELIPRLYPVPPGTLLLDGRDVTEIPLEELRRTVALVPQEAFLFSETIRENILFGAGPGREIDPETLGRIFMVSGLEEMVRALPDGVDTLLGERGVNLSGGEKQRVALARALARGAPVVLLDDSLAAVDAETEVRILRALREELEERTVLAASHRISTVAGADEILVLDGGRVVERGTHGELMARGGLYALLARRQRLTEGPFPGLEGEDP